MIATLHHPAIRIPTFPARPMDGGQLELAIDPIGEWYDEAKYNGWRSETHVESGLMFNRKGEELSISDEFAPALEKLRKLPFQWLDVEALERRHGIGRGSLIILDYIPKVRTETYVDRRRYMEMVCAISGIPKHTQLDQPIENNSIYLTACYRSAGGRQLYDILKRCNGKEALNCEFYEGIVRKKADSIYPMQLRSPEQTTHNWVKHRWHF